MADDRAQLATLATVEFRRRQANARKKVAEGAIDRTTAERLVRAWAAMACRLGADIAELRPLIDGFTLIFGRTPTETERRACVAEDLCPREAMVAVLVKARDAAAAKAIHKSGGPVADPEAAAQAAALQRLADHFAPNSERQAA
jgi:hypothetical protein